MTSDTTHKKPVVIIDGLSVFMRHYCANPAMSGNGEHMGGFIGFLGSIRDLCSRFMPQQVVVVWEGGGSKKRRLIDKTYKKGRKPIKMNRYYGDDLPDSQGNRDSQLAKLVTALRHTKVKQIYVPDCEGDDAVAHLTRVITRDKKDTPVIITSSDRDFYQLICDNVSVWSPGRRKLITTQECLQEFCVHPRNFCLAKAIVGDSADNVMGVTGVGYKTIGKRFPAFKNPDTLSFQDVVDECKEKSKTSNVKAYRSIVENAELIKKNLRLVSLDAGTLPATIASTIESSYLSDVTNGTPNKMELYRFIIKEGLNNFDIDSIFIMLR